MGEVGIPALFGLTAVLGACQAEPSNNNAGAAAARVRPLGEKVYFTSCARCHGNAIEGNRAAPR